MSKSIGTYTLLFTSVLARTILHLWMGACSMAMLVAVQELVGQMIKGPKACLRVLG